MLYGNIVSLITDCSHVYRIGSGEAEADEHDLVAKHGDEVDY